LPVFAWLLKDMERKSRVRALIVCKFSACLILPNPPI
jgi:hypothetical protein